MIKSFSFMPFAASLALGIPAHAQQVDLSSGSAAQIIADLKPGQYVWAPEIAPDGPMLMIVNLKSQRALLYRNGVPIAATTVSTGKPGHATPTGVFTILQKHVVHHSTKYDNAPMPYMERLTWYGVALHAGSLPGYPASHGCIRLPTGFAKLLYGQTSLGMTVVIADLPSAPRVAPTPQLSGDSGDTSAGKMIWNPEKSIKGPVSVIISVTDRRAIVLRNGVVIGSAPISISGPVTGTFAYALKGIDTAGQHWVRLQLSESSHGEPEVPADEWKRYSAPEAFRTAVTAIVQPGMTIVVTPDSLKSAAVPATILESDR